MNQTYKISDVSWLHNRSEDESQPREKLGQILLVGERAPLEDLNLLLDVAAKKAGTPSTNAARRK